MLLLEILSNLGLLVILSTIFFLVGPGFTLILVHGVSLPVPLNRSIGLD